MKTLRIGILVCFGVAACTAKSGGPPTVSSQRSALAIPCDAKRVLETVCQQCHGDPTRNGAPFPIVTYADTQVVSNGEPIWHQMRVVVQRGTMPLSPVQIDPADRATLALWLSNDAPPRSASETCDVVVSVPDAGNDAQSAAPDSGSDEADGDSQSTNSDAGTLAEVVVVDSSSEVDILSGNSDAGATAPDAGPVASD